MSGSVHTSIGASRMSLGASCGGKQNSCKIGKIAAIVQFFLNSENLAELYLLKTWLCFNIAWLSTNEYSDFTMLHRI